MKPTLQLKVSQQLTLTPQLQQSIKLLQLSTVELEQEIENFLLENPLLERAEPGDEEASDRDGAREAAEAGDATVLEAGAKSTALEDATGESDDSSVAEANIERDYANEAEWQDESAGSYSSAGHQDDDFDPQDIQPAVTSLRDHLVWQLALMPLSERDQTLVRYLIEALDDDGYLSSSLDELVEGIPPDFELEEGELAIALAHLQHLDPTGVGARDTRECLLLQLDALPADAAQVLARTIVNEHLELLAHRDFSRLKKLTGADDDALRQAQVLIRSLNPRPGAQFTSFDARYVTPDVMVRKVRGKWTASINGDAFPRLRVNRLYAEILSRQRRGENNLSGQLQEARWLIKNVQQRFDTIHRVSQAIVDRQRQFFEHGEVAMRPLVLREIAEVCDLHESTISRVTTQKYMSTPRGLFELKYFFGSHVATEAGGACSATAIRALIKQLVAAENAKKPLSDNQIAEILGQQGIVVARRTIAKYRESLGIPATNLRKSL